MPILYLGPSSLTPVDGDDVCVGQDEGGNYTSTSSTSMDSPGYVLLLHTERILSSLFGCKSRVKTK